MCGSLMGSGGGGLLALSRLAAAQAPAQSESLPEAENRPPAATPSRPSASATALAEQQADQRPLLTVAGVQRQWADITQLLQSVAGPQVQALLAHVQPDLAALAERLARVRAESSIAAPACQPPLPRRDDGCGNTRVRLKSFLEGGGGGSRRCRRKLSEATDAAAGAAATAPEPATAEVPAAGGAASASAAAQQARRPALPLSMALAPSRKQHYLAPLRAAAAAERLDEAAAAAAARAQALPPAPVSSQQGSAALLVSARAVYQAAGGAAALAGPAAALGVPARSAVPQAAVENAQLLPPPSISAAADPQLAAFVGATQLQWPPPTTAAVAVGAAPAARTPLQPVAGLAVPAAAHATGAAPAGVSAAEGAAAAVPPAVSRSGRSLQQPSWMEGFSVDE